MVDMTIKALKNNLQLFSKKLDNADIIFEHLDNTYRLDSITISNDGIKFKLELA